MRSSGQRIKACRQLNDMTQEDVAKHLGIGKQAVYKYEIGAVTNIPLDSVEKMAELFHTTPSYLAGWTDDNTPPVNYSETEKRLVSAYRLAEPKYQEIALELLEEHPAKKDSSADQTA